MASVTTAINSGKLVAIPSNNVLPKTGPICQCVMQPPQAVDKTIDDPVSTTTPITKNKTKNLKFNFDILDCFLFILGCKFLITAIFVL